MPLRLSFCVLRHDRNIFLASGLGCCVHRHRSVSLTASISLVTRVTETYAILIVRTLGKRGTRGRTMESMVTRGLRDHCISMAWGWLNGI